MNDRVDTIISGRRERLQKMLLRPLGRPTADPGQKPLGEDARQHLMEYAEELYWNELEWENITAEEETGGAPVSQLIFPGFLAFVRGLLLEEVMEDAKAPAEPRPELVEEILRFLAGRVVALEEELGGGDPDEDRQLEDELANADHLLDLVLYRFHDLTEAEIERLEEARTARADSGTSWARRRAPGPSVHHRRPRPGHPYLAGAPLLVAHRGGAALAPENTVEAFSSALGAWGADMLEMDVRTTADDRVVVLHDATVDRTTDGAGAVRFMPLARVRELDAGYRFVDPRGEHPFRGRGVRIPLLDDVLAAFPDARLNVEVKAREAAVPTVELVRRHAATHRVLIAAEHERNRRGVRYEGPWGASRRQLGPFWLLHRTPLSFLVTPRVDVFQVPLRWRGMPVVTRRFVQEAHRRNIPVHVWTVDDPDDMRALLDLGVDGIQSDRPDILARVLTEETGRPPAPAHRGSGEGT